MGRPTEYETPRIQVLVRFVPADLLVVKTEARHLGISVNRVIERAVQDWIMREAGETLETQTIGDTP
jgi:hypothetical protein